MTGRHNKGFRAPLVNPAALRKMFRVEHTGATRTDSHRQDHNKYRMVIVACTECGKYMRMSPKKAVRFSFYLCPYCYVKKDVLDTHLEERMRVAEQKVADKRELQRAIIAIAKRKAEIKRR